MGRIINENVYAVAYSIDNVLQPAVLVEAGDASDADATVLLAAHAAGAAGKPVRVVAIADVSAAQWTGAGAAPGS